MRQTVAHKDIEVVQSIWHDHFANQLPPSQFARRLRLYPIDVISEGIAAGFRWIKRMNTDSRTKTGNDLIRNCSAVMHDIKADRELDAQ